MSFETVYPQFTFGNGPLRVFVLSQILPFGPHRELFESTFSDLSPFFEFTVADCFEGIHERSDLQQAAEYWEDRISNKNFNAFIGFSLGGCILQRLTVLEPFCDNPFIFLSSPTVITPRTRAALQPVLDLLEQGLTVNAIELLDRLVQPKSQKNYKLTQSNLIDESGQMNNVRLRLLRGFSFFFLHGSQPPIKSNNVKKARSLYVVGEKSQLITQDEVKIHFPDQLWIVPQAGMRVMNLMDSEMIEQMKVWMRPTPRLL